MPWITIVEIFLAYYSGYSYRRWEERRNKKREYPFQWSCPIKKCNFDVKCNNKTSFGIFIEDHIKFHQEAKKNDGVPTESEA